MVGGGGEDWPTASGAHMYSHAGVGLGKAHTLCLLISNNAGAISTIRRTRGTLIVDR